MLRKSWCSWSFSFDDSFGSLFSHCLGVVGVWSLLSFVALFVSQWHGFSLICHSHTVSLVSHGISLVCKLSISSSICGWCSWNSKSTFILELSSLLTGVWWFRILSSGISIKVFFVNIFDKNFSLSIVLTSSIVVLFTGVTLFEQIKKLANLRKRWNLLLMVMFWMPFSSYYISYLFMIKNS